ncbi:MAG: hypothetical protein WB562_18085 [Candidatus Sulfotelmatobacter sp.]
MRKLVLIGLVLLVSGSVAMAQKKIDTKWHCPKAETVHQLDVGDAPDHIYWIGQGSCTATSSEGDLKEKNGQFTEFHEGWKASFTFHGRYNSTSDNGDKVFYTYEGTASTDTTKPAANKWKIVSGSGTYKGIKGSGSCAGKASADGSYDWNCTGTYSMGKAK